MRQGPILAESRERQDDRSTRELPLWEKDPAPGDATPPWPRQDTLRPDDWRTVLQGARSVVAACTTLHPAWMREALGWSSQTAQCRTYLFGPEPWVSAPELQSLVKAGGARLLTRLGAEPPADFLVADGERGWLVLGAPGQPRRWLLPLGPALAHDLHELFVHLFWHQARRESGPEGRFRECPPSPFPAPGEAGPALTRGQLLSRAEPPVPLLPDAELAVEPRRLPVEGTPRLLLTPPTSDDFTRLRERVGQGTALAWFDRGLPRLALTRRRMVMELGEGPSRLRLEFEAEEAIRIKHLLELGASAGAWRFHAARALGAVRGPVRLEGSAAEQRVHDTLPVDLGDVGAAELLALDDARPTSWREPPALTRCVHYRWRVVPPQAPPGARAAKLLTEWEQLDAHIEARANSAVGVLEKQEQEEGKRGLLARLTGLVSRWKDVNSRRKRLRHALDEVREQPLSRRPDDAARLVTLLEDQEKELLALDRFCAEQEAQEELRLAEEAQRAAHAREVERARLEHARLAPELEAHQTRLQEARDALPALEERWRARSEEVLRAAHAARTARAREQLDACQARLEEHTGRRGELQAALDALPKKEKKEIERRKKELYALDKDLKRLSSEKETHRRAAEAPFQPGAERPGPDEALARLEEQLEASRRDVTALEREAARRQAALDALARAADAAFHFQPPTLSARPGHKAAAHKPVVIPREPLPEVGELLEHGERRYLAVRTWEEAARAKADAQRLGARLVAPTR
ncbi:hypothetical protein [Archangium primigenium]|uniref:hypothetical protein n=1 Tax=[Archangium] primigenium TaxID=2792470 RepID=UPI00195B5064|nr:hypothetical protein [Archangium primigenium]MBM7114916.1 hypothetical protein [Archangium primigenium]